MAPRKQRHTITRVCQRLPGEHAMTGVFYPVLQRYVQDRRPEILAETGRAPPKVFIPAELDEFLTEDGHAGGHRWTEMPSHGLPFGYAI